MSDNNLWKKYPSATMPAIDSLSSTQPPPPAEVVLNSPTNPSTSTATGVADITPGSTSGSATVCRSSSPVDRNRIHRKKVVAKHSYRFQEKQSAREDSLCRVDGRDHSETSSTDVADVTDLASTATQLPLATPAPLIPDDTDLNSANPGPDFGPEPQSELDSPALEVQPICISSEAEDHDDTPFIIDLKPEHEFVPPVSQPTSFFKAPPSHNGDGSASARNVKSSSRATKSSTKSLSFHPQVKVQPIPHHSSLSFQVKAIMYSSSLELEINAERNRYEFAAEGWDWRQVVEDERMYVLSPETESSLSDCPDGTLNLTDTEKIHPAHLLRLYNAMVDTNGTAGSETIDISINAVDDTPASEDFDDSNLALTPEPITQQVPCSATGTDRVLDDMMDVQSSVVKDDIVTISTDCSSSNATNETNDDWDLLLLEQEVGQLQDLQFPSSSATLGSDVSLPTPAVTQAVS